MAHNSLGLVYLPNGINRKITVETVTNTSILSNIAVASNEVQVTSVVRITSDNATSSFKKPAIVDLIKTIQLSDEAENKVIPLHASSESSKWEELGAECNCQVLNDRISFQVSHFSLYTVISRKPYPSSTVRVKPASSDSDIPVPVHSSAPTELTISELPGFKVQILPSSVESDRETDITATVLYDCLAVCSEDERNCLASSCIELEPHGITFSKAVSISIPIPDFGDIMMNHPDAQLQIWHSTGCTNYEWNVVEHYMCQDEEGLYVAIIQVSHFSRVKPKWMKGLSSCLKRLLNHSFNIKVRCQVFMSQETLIQTRLTFSIAVLFYPYKEEPDSVPHNYKYLLADSDLLDLKVLKNDVIQFKVELSALLSSQEQTSINHEDTFKISGRQQKAFFIEIDRNMKLQGGLPMGKLSIGTQQEERYHTLAIIKVC